MDESICPLSGRPCDHPKSLILKHVTPKGVVSLNLCSDCGLEAINGLGIGYGSVVTPSMLVKKLLAAQPGLTCPHCGFCLNDLRDGRLGCDRCYVHFGEAMQHLLGQVHEGATQHCGKTPKHPNPETPVSEPAEPAADPAILAIQAKLDRAVRDERYEDAAKLRDIIKELKKLP